MATSIPIKHAKKFAEDHNQDVLIVIGWNQKTNTTTTTTYGRTLPQCVKAATVGNYIKKHALGYPDELCHDVPARAKRKS